MFSEYYHTDRLSTSWSHFHLGSVRVHTNRKQKLAQAPGCIRNYSYHWFTHFCSNSLLFCHTFSLAAKPPASTPHHSPVPPQISAPVQRNMYKWKRLDLQIWANKEKRKKKGFAAGYFCVWRCLTYIISAQPYKQLHQHSQSSHKLQCRNSRSGKQEFLRVCLVSNPIYLTSNYILIVTKELGKETIVSF